MQYVPKEQLMYAGGSERVNGKYDEYGQSFAALAGRALG
jgi:hypothetical protein